MPICIDHLWRKVDDLKGAMAERKFPSIMNVMKTALILGDGNTEFERVQISEASISGVTSPSQQRPLTSVWLSFQMLSKLTLQRTSYLKTPQPVSGN